MTLVQVADRVGVDKGYISKVEHGYRPPMADRFGDLLALALGITVKDLRALAALGRGTVEVGDLSLSSIKQVVELVDSLRKRDA